MAKNPFRFGLQILTFLTLLHFSFSHPDLHPLMAFKSASDALNKLTNWNLSAGDPCTFYGVSCLQNRVSHLVLEDVGLQGGFEPLTSLDKLRVLSLKRNRLSGHIPNLSNLTSLKLLFLSHNGFSGEFPGSLASLFRLYRLDLSYNNFSGEIPDGSVNRLTHLLTLRLEENQFSGPISSLDLPNLQDFNVSGNRLTGEVPKSLSGFPNTSFDRNPVLCGSPLPSCKVIVSDPSKPGSKGPTGSPLTPTVVSSSPTSIPDSSPATMSPASTHHTGGKMSALAIVGIILGDVLVLALISGLLFCYFWRHLAGKARDRENASQLIESEKIVYSARSPYSWQNSGFERGKMVFFEGGRRFELEDLLRASAEMLGKGGFGTAYKAMLDDGNVVAVKRLKDAQLGGKREFEQQMDVLGRLRHPNVVSLKAYYFARDEKLLVYDYMPNGSLFWLLHGNRGPGRTPLDWTTRMKVASGVAHGLAFIHHCNSSPRLSHGNLKSTNVLLDNTGNPRLSDFGLAHFASPTATTKPNGYRAPEALTEGRKFSHQKADVYAFGVLLLEILTGKCPDNSGGGDVIDLPKWVQSVVREEWTAEVFDLELMRFKDIEEEMVGLLQIAMACTCVAPDQRPRIGSVLRMIEEMRGLKVSPSYESFESDSPSVSELTDG